MANIISIRRAAIRSSALDSRSCKNRACDETLTIHLREELLERSARHLALVWPLKTFPKRKGQKSREMYNIIEPFLGKLLKDFTHSKIKKYKIVKKGPAHETIISTGQKGVGIDILADILSTMAGMWWNESTFNFKSTNVNGKNGYIWNEKVKMSIQGKDANNTIREIIRLSIINNYTFDIEIQLQNNEIISYIYE